MRAVWIPVLCVALALGATRAARAAEVEAHVGRRSLTVGETTTLEVIVRGSVTGIQEPDFEIPFGLQVLGSSRNTSLSGRNGPQTVFRYEIAPLRAGRFALGPIRARVGGQSFESPAIMLSVSAAATTLGAGGQGPASLVADLSPKSPYVGQPVILRVRLIQRARLAEDPRYTPPPTTGFWAERASEPESYYADESHDKVLVTETRTRLYPLAGGRSEVGEAVAILALALPQSYSDPMQWYQGRPPRREVAAKSAPVAIKVRPLPPGAPPGFEGAVGRFGVTWSADRERTAQDVPVTLRLEVRGIGNLPLLHTPALASRDFEVFPSTMEDSLGEPGTLGVGRRRFQWTALPHRQGALTIPGPEFVWFDPDLGGYRSAVGAPVTIEVGPPMVGANLSSDGMPDVFVHHPMDPSHHGTAPWAYALAGLAFGGAFRIWRRSGRPDPLATERARQREWVHAVSRSAGPDFWRAAVQACDWLESHGHAVPELRTRIATSRYGGVAMAGTGEGEVRSQLREGLEKALPAPPPRASRAMAIPLAIAGVALCIVFGPLPGASMDALRAHTADQAAHQGDLERARREWLALWNEGKQSPAVAARLAWAEARSGAIGPAALWILRGDLGDPRDPALNWAVGQVRDAGGLTGFHHQRLPIRRIEWALLALMFGALAIGTWPRFAVAAPAALVTLLCATTYPAQGWQAARETRGVVNASVTLEGTSLELEPGQVVRVLQRSGNRARAIAGRGVSGWLPVSALQTLERTP